MKFNNENEKVIQAKFLHNFFVTKLLRDESLKDYLQLILHKSTGVALEKIQKNFGLLDIKISKASGIKDEEVDLIAECDEYIFNIEANRSNRKYIMKKNASYICNLIMRQTENGSRTDYQNIKKVYQICMNLYDQFGVGEFVYESEWQEKRLHLPRIDLVNVTDIDIDKLSKIDYNIIKEKKDSLEYLLYIFASSNHEELDKIYEGSEIMKKVKEKAYNLEKNADRYLIYSHDDMMKAVGIEEGEERGRQEGLSEGQEREKIASARKMLSRGCDFEFIKDITGLSLEKINEIKTSIYEIKPSPNLSVNESNELANFGNSENDSD